MQGTSAVCRPVVAFSMFLVALACMLTCSGSPAHVRPCLGRAYDDSAGVPLPDQFKHPQHQGPPAATHTRCVAHAPASPDAR